MFCVYSRASSPKDLTMQLYTGVPVTTERYLNMVTEKGLRYIIANNPNSAEVEAAIREIKKRNLPIGDRKQQGPREADGYEKEY